MALTECENQNRLLGLVLDYTKVNSSSVHDNEIGLREYVKSIPERDHLFYTNENLPAELDYGKAKVLTNLNLEGNKRRSTVMPGNMSANILGLKGLASEVEK